MADELDPRVADADVPVESEADEIARRAREYTDATTLTIPPDSAGAPAPAAAPAPTDMAAWRVQGLPPPLPRPPLNLDDLTTAPLDYWDDLYTGYEQGTISGDDLYLQRRQRQHDVENPLLDANRQLMAQVEAQDAERAAQAQPQAPPTAEGLPPPPEREPRPEDPLGPRSFASHLRFVPGVGFVSVGPGGVEATMTVTKTGREDLPPPPMERETPPAPPARGMTWDTVRGFLRGPLKAVDATGSAAAAFAEFLTGLDISHIRKASVAEAVLPGEPTTVVGGLSQGLGQFLTVALPVGRGIQTALAGARTATSFGQRLLQWAVTVEGADTVADFLAFEANDPRAANLFNEFFPGMENVVSEYLAATGDDSELEGRLKNVIEGRILDATVAGTIVATLKGLKLARTATQAVPKIAARVTEEADRLGLNPTEVQAHLKAGLTLARSLPGYKTASEAVRSETGVKLAGVVAAVVAGQYAGGTDEEQALLALMAAGLNPRQAKTLAKEVADRIPAAAALRNTKVIEAGTGELIRVYHGSPIGIRGDLNPAMANPEALYGPGLYFTENPKVAGGGKGRDLGYAQPRGRPSMPLENLEDYFKPGEIVGGYDGWDRVIEFHPPTPKEWRWSVTVEAVDPKTGKTIGPRRRHSTVPDAIPAPNVRPAHLDIRNPFDIDDIVPEGFERRLADAIDARRGAGTSDYALDRIEAASEEMNLTGNTVYRIFAQHAADEAGTPIGKAALNEALQALGYDGITHMGGAITGTEPHRVWIAFSPEQVHSPFEVAAEARRVRTISGGGPALVTPDDPRSLAAQYAEAVIEARRGGPRTHELVQAEAQALVNSGAVSWDYIQAIAPGTTLADAPTVAVVMKLADSGMKMKALTDQALAATDPTEALAHAQAVVQQLWVHGALDPKRIGLITELGRGVSAMNDPTSGLNRFLLQFEEMLLDPNAPIKDPMAVVRAIAQFQTPGQLAVLAKQTDKPGFWQMFNEYYVNGLLWGPKSWMANFLGNSAATLWAIPERALAARVGDAASGVQRGEATAMLEAILGSTVDAFRLASLALKTGESQFEQAFGTGAVPHGHKIEGAGRAITGANVAALANRALGTEKFELVGTAGQAVDAIGGLLRFPMRILAATDDFFKVVNYRMELAAVAAREAGDAVPAGLTPKAAAAALDAEKQRIMANPTMAVRKQAEAFALYQTFTKELGETGQLIQQIADKPFGRLVLPFVRTPINLFKYAGERTPLALATMSYWKAVKGTDRVAADLAKARMALGSMTMGVASVMAYGGLITGGGPSDPQQRAKLEATGWKPYSVRAGNYYIGYNRLEPIGMLIGLAADYVDAVVNSDAETAWQWTGEAAWALSVTTAKQFASRTFFRGAAETMAFIADPDRMSDARAASFLQSLAPFSGLQRQLETAVDPTLSEARGVMDRILAQVPGLSATVPPRRTLLDGEKVYASAAYGPIGISRGKQDAEMNALIALEAHVPRIPDIVEEGIELTPEMRDYWAVQRGTMTLGGKTLRERLAATMASPRWDRMNNDARGAELEGDIREYHEQAKEKMKQRYPIIKKSQAAAERKRTEQRRTPEPMPASPLLRSLTR